MKAKVNIFAKLHPYIFFTLQLDSVWGIFLKCTTSSQPLLLVHACSLVLRPLPSSMWPGNEGSMTLLAALCYTEPLQQLKQCMSWSRLQTYDSVVN